MLAAKACATVARRGDVHRPGAISAPARPSLPAPSSVPVCGTDEEVPSPTFTLVQVYEPAPRAIRRLALRPVPSRLPGGRAGTRHRGCIRRGHHADRMARAARRPCCRTTASTLTLSAGADPDSRRVLIEARTPTGGGGCARPDLPERGRRHRRLS